MSSYSSSHTASSSYSSSKELSENEEPETRNWLDLPRDVTASILLKLGAVEILTSAQHVCTSWRSICKDPVIWRTIDMQNLGDLHIMPDDLEILCRRAVDRSCGQLVDINVEYFGTDDLLKYITDSTSHLRRLRLVYCDDISDEGLCEVAGKLPLLEELDISIGNISKDSLEVIGRNCPHIRSLKFNMEVFRRPHIELDDEAFAIAKTMPELRHLQLFGNKLTNVGLLAILDGCPRLESLDLRQCFNINMEGALGKRCAEQLKDLRRPNDPTDDYPFDATIPDGGSFDEDYPLGISDTDFLSDDDYEYDFYAFSDGSDISDDVGYYFDPDTY
ncbi:F-box protein SKIP19 [Neltuma alba]|uniref:F-box protein SKIP19 n=1 Tax=Neltuma alba TaxID=207710 RepID=UPI0010A3B098|nr:F-box protein SKIP19-like [Prosopis alba]XP_028759198.1 F-box protein SKIP19-like [Prosopis alba]XP_028759199.1 F-box protein SKIP19-like [Prosopis alba]